MFKIKSAIFVLAKLFLFKYSETLIVEDLNFLKLDLESRCKISTI